MAVSWTILPNLFLYRYTTILPITSKYYYNNPNKCIQFLRGKGVIIRQTSSAWFMPNRFEQ